MATTVAEFLGKDHDRLHILLVEYQRERTTDRAKAVTTFREFRDGLERHILWEEGLLFTQFEMKTGMYEAGPTIVMRREHTEIQSLLAAIQEALETGTSAIEPLEARLQAVLTAHNEKEEAILYPWIDRALHGRELARIVEQMQTQAARPAECQHGFSAPVR